MDKKDKVISWFAHWGEHGHVKLVKVNSDEMAIRMAKRICCRHLTHVTRNETCGKYVKIVVVYKSKKLYVDELQKEKVTV